MRDATNGTSEEVCAAWSDFFYLPRDVWGAFGALAGTESFQKVFHEVGVPTVLRVLQKRDGAAPEPNVLDCWGCSQGWARDPAVIAAFGCGHRVDQRRTGVRRWPKAPPTSVVVHSFRLSSRRATISRSGLDVFFLERARAEDPRSSDVESPCSCPGIDLQLPHVRDAFQALLDDQRPPPLAPARHHRDGTAPRHRRDGLVRGPRGIDLEAAIATLDADLGAWDGKDRYWQRETKNKWTSGCCALPSARQTPCNCVAKAPPSDTPAARAFGSNCARPDLVRARLDAHGPAAA